MRTQTEPTTISTPIPPSHPGDWTAPNTASNVPRTVALKVIESLNESMCSGLVRKSRPSDGTLAAGSAAAAHENSSTLHGAPFLLTSIPPCPSYLPLPHGRQCGLGDFVAVSPVPKGTERKRAGWPALKMNNFVRASYAIARRRKPPSFAVVRN